MIMWNLSMFIISNRIIAAWRQVTQESRQDLKTKVAFMPVVRVRRPFLAWYQLCSRLWRRRGSLIRRFFCNCRQLVYLRSAQRGAVPHALALWSGLRKQRTLRFWARWARSRGRWNRFRSPRVRSSPAESFSACCHEPKSENMRNRCGETQPPRTTEMGPWNLAQVKHTYRKSFGSPVD
jgi:hypothetical protein